MRKVEITEAQNGWFIRYSTDDNSNYYKVFEHFGSLVTFLREFYDEFDRGH